MHQFRFRAVISLDPPPAKLGEPSYQSGMHHLLHAWRLDEPVRGKYLAAMIFSDDGMPLIPGHREIATIAVTDDEALSYLAAGQTFTLWGSSTGRGVISRRVFTDQGPS